MDDVLFVQLKKVQKNAKERCFNQKVEKNGKLLSGIDSPFQSIRFNLAITWLRTAWQDLCLTDFFWFFALNYLNTRFTKLKKNNLLWRIWKNKIAVISNNRLIKKSLLSNKKIPKILVPLLQLLISSLKPLKCPFSLAYKLLRLKIMSCR